MGTFLKMETYPTESQSGDVQLNLAQLNSCSTDVLVEKFQWVINSNADTRWVLEKAAAQRPFRTISDFARAMMSQLLLCGDKRERDILLEILRNNSDPHLHRLLDEDSEKGPKELTPFEQERFVNLNTAYKNKYTFPFMCAGRGKTKEYVLRKLEKSLESDFESQFEYALDQMRQMVRIRLTETIMAPRAQQVSL